jgi:hypothetical protein
MNNIIGARPPAWLRGLALVALLWNLIGVAFYLGEVGVLGGPFAPPEPAIEMPGWVTAAYAIGVFGGALGAIGLLLLKRWAGPVLWASLIALVLDWGWVMFASGAGIQPLGIVVLVVAAGLVWLASTGAKRGWLS